MQKFKILTKFGANIRFPLNEVLHKRTKMFLQFKQVLFSDFEWQIFKNGHISANRQEI